MTRSFEVQCSPESTWIIIDNFRKYNRKGKFDRLKK